jgi:outer membrane protein assembly factor BamB
MVRPDYTTTGCRSVFFIGKYNLICIDFDKDTKTIRRQPVRKLINIVIFLIGLLIIGQITPVQPVQNVEAAPEAKGLPQVETNAGDDWPMLAANPQRTSWNAVEVRGNLEIEWYHPIEPYIPYKIQPIAANGKLYISTARGLYTFSATNGALLWVFPTEVPLGHSPTIVTVNGKSIAFVGGYDHKIHALDANTGAAITGYTSFEAAAGFETNPLVVNNTIYAGNRDGYFYAMDAINGSLKWKYKTDGPILFSAAYKDGVVYFASNDALAYALNATTGALIWKSQKLPGAGFHSFWPVIYTRKTSGKDYVIFSSGENYKHLTFDSGLTGEETQELFGDNGIPRNGLIGSTSTSISGDWVSGTMVMNAGLITDYYQDKPYRRTVFFLNRSNGQEFTFDSNSDGQPEYAPFSWSGVTQSGSKYPPVINGVDGVYYQATAYYNGGWVSRGGPVGWKFGTQYVSRVHTGNSQGAVIGHASDEPMAFSSGGKMIYWSLCCDREAGGYDVTIPFGQPNRDWYYYGYSLASNNIAPGYQQMYNSGESSAYNNMDGWQIYSGKNKSKNGIYGKHGSTQSPPIPYQGKLFVLKGNALIAFSPSGTNPKTPLPLATIVTPPNTSTTPAKTELIQRLETEVQKMLAAGPLRAGYQTSGLVDIYGSGKYAPNYGEDLNDKEFGELFDYFQNPADTVYTLLLAYPHLSSNTQQQVKTYLQNYYGPGKTYDFTRIVHIGFGTGAARELTEVPPEDVARWGQNYTSPYAPSTEPICGWCGYWRHFPPFSFYAAWQYAHLVGNDNPAFAKNIFDRMSNKLEAPLSDSTFIKRPYWLNQYIAGYKGYLELRQLAGYSSDQSRQTTYQHLLDLRVNNFTKDTPYPPIGSTAGSTAGETYNNTLAVARNFMFLTPELAEYMDQHIHSQVQTALNEYEYVAPYWFVGKFDDTYGEGTLHHLYDSPALFQAKAFILQESYEDLSKWLDAPVFYRGDLFYIQNLAALLATGPPAPSAPDFALRVEPTSQTVTAGDTTHYTIQVDRYDNFTGTVNLVTGVSSPAGLIISSPSPSALSSYGAQSTLTVTDNHPPSFSGAVWYTIPFTATSSGITRNATATLLVNGQHVFLPVVIK